MEIVGGMIDHRLSNVDDRRKKRCAFWFPLGFPTKLGSKRSFLITYGCISQPREVE